MPRRICNRSTISKIGIAVNVADAEEEDHFGLRHSPCYSPVSPLGPPPDDGLVSVDGRPISPPYYYIPKENSGPKPDCENTTAVEEEEEEETTSSPRAESYPVTIRRLDFDEQSQDEYSSASPFQSPSLNSNLDHSSPEIRECDHLRGVESVRFFLRE